MMTEQQVSQFPIIRFHSPGIDDGQSDPYKETAFVCELLYYGNFFAVLQTKLKLRKFLTWS